MEFFGTIYNWFSSLFGTDLGEHLWGWNGDMQEYSNINLFNVCGIIALVSAFIVCFVYYYVINHPRFNRWWSWLSMLILTGLINLFTGFYFAYRDWSNEVISSDIISNITRTDCWMFGFVNAIVSVVFFIIITFIIKWGSHNCKLSPC